MVPSFSWTVWEKNAKKKSGGIFDAAVQIQTGHILNTYRLLYTWNQFLFLDLTTLHIHNLVHKFKFRYKLHTQTPLLIVHLQRGELCSECERCACARFRDEWRAATTHPKAIWTVHSLTTRCLKCFIFSSCCVLCECLSPLTNSSPLVPKYNGHPSHRVRHARQTTRGN